jgi:hypothetical protein
MKCKAHFLTVKMTAAIIIVAIPLLVSGLDQGTPSSFGESNFTLDSGKCDCGAWGDADNDAAFGLEDIVYLVNFICRGRDATIQPFACPYNIGDANCNGRIELLDAILFINYFYRESTAGLCGNPCPGAIMTERSNCKPHNQGKTADELAFRQECLQYEYDGMGTLLIKHVNAAFNCCPDTIFAEITILQDELLITEYEAGWEWCTCSCLYDLDYRIDNLPPGLWRIGISYSYLRKIFEITLDLTNPITGEYCEERHNDPWGP